MVTTPVEITIWRMRWLFRSLTKRRVPSVEAATLIGFRKLAPAPVPSANVPEPEPARVVTTPVDMIIWRIRFIAHKEKSAVSRGGHMVWEIEARSVPRAIRKRSRARAREGRHHLPTCRPKLPQAQLGRVLFHHVFITTF